MAVRDWIKAVGTKTADIEPGAPLGNGSCASVNASFRDEFLNGEIFCSLREAQILIEKCRKHHHTKRPNRALGYRPPAPETFIPMASKASHALTIKLNHSRGADQWTDQRRDQVRERHARRQRSCLRRSPDDPGPSH
ncbi:transposase [Cognatishimia sp. F0-27]|nr:transposase [Cognatishimia sp. F0-27]